MPRAGLTPARVVDAAESLVDTEGLDALSLARLAAQLGVRQPSLYNHLASLESLRRDIAVRAKRELAAVLLDADSGDADARTRVVAIARALRRWAREHPGRYLLTVRAPSPEDADDVAASAELLALFESVLAPALDETERVHLIRALRAQLHGMLDLERRGGFGLPVDTEVSADRAVEALLHTWLPARAVTD